MRGGSKNQNLAEQLDAVVGESLNLLANYIETTGWRGREREVVSLYAFACLLKCVKRGTVLYDPAQIGIEVAVPQVIVPGKKQKAQVTKDLVIWDEPGATCWDEWGNPKYSPLAVLLWKLKGFRRNSGRNLDAEFIEDVKWLESFSREHSGFVGYAVLVDISHSRPHVRCWRVSAGKVEGDWLVLP